ncbi:DNA topoisomerase 3-alpha [Cimex lectularius]|uniref:DNA topoisomerase n=1 Tax=Cimex lectularius TaxID=79782 RepID=A0A8I6RR87_CIMLE|nr:DNA topoisomerase 3-alpha [Cimex lectularius]
MLLKICFSVRFNTSCRLSNARSFPVMKVLNVAEKNDAAKNISFFLSRGNTRKREGLSVYNKIYEFECEVFGQRCSMSMTSVSGHLLNYEFISSYKSWQSCSPEDLFDAPVVKGCTEDAIKIKNTLEREAKKFSKLIIWTDCDREGENIGYEIIDTCKRVNPSLDVYRAKFSEITSASIRRAINNLIRPDKNISNAVDVRQELDLRIGASFTRFQTLRLQKVFPVLADHLLSYGSCQFPTLGFVVERYLEREKFISEPFWKIKVTHTIDDLTVEFRWARDRLFDQAICQALLARCQERPTAKVEKVDGKPKSKWRPTPLDTTEMEKIASRKLKINAKEALRIAEKLYTKGFISYPRTETNIFPDSINLRNLVEIQTQDSRWGNFAQKVLQDGPNPRQGKKSDQSHPPIHPIAYTTSLEGNDARMYEFIVRHFLACVSKDAKAHETLVSIDINTEKFSASGLMILERNYLDVYPYENWNSKNIHRYEVNQTFEPTSLDITESQTSAPNLLTEADLIALMEKHGIGTDATHAEHIETIKNRFYVGLEDNIHFVPSAIGMALVEGYDTMGFAMSKPVLRAELEAELKRICDGVRQPEIVLREQISKYRELFRIAKSQVNKIDSAVAKYLQTTARTLDPREDPLSVATPISQPVMPCRMCSLKFVVKTNQMTQKSYISCQGYPSCKAAIWLPTKVVDFSVSNQSCEVCGPNVKKIEFKFSPGSMAPYYPNNFTGCINGCDSFFLEMLDIRIPRPASSTATTENLTSNYSSQYSSQSTRTSQQNRSSNNSALSGHNMLGSSRPQNRGSHNSNSNDFDNGRGQKRPREPPDDNVEHKCFCDLPVKKLTVRKEGPNLGREFLICSKDTDDKCGYYAWFDELTEESNSTKCFCNLSVRKLVVKKDGPNKGKTFFCCPKGQNEPNRCSFFLWEEESSNRQDRGEYRNNQRGNSSSRTSNFRARTSDSNQRGRKCGICSQTGHTRRNCPNNSNN